jgi:hypothetical protein
MSGRSLIGSVSDMARWRPSIRRIKRLRLYDPLEAARALGVSRQTIWRWKKQGLTFIPNHRPTLFRGADILDFVHSRRLRRKRRCGPGRLFCLRCKEPRAPAEGMLEFRPDVGDLGTLMALCPNCGGLMCRRASLRSLGNAAGGHTVSIQRGRQRLGEMTEARSNDKSEVREIS